MRRHAILAIALALTVSLGARGDEKLVLLDDAPRHLTQFEVAPDGGRLIFGSGSAYLVFDAKAQLVDRFGLPSGAAKELCPLPTGGFIAFNTHASGHIALFRPDGTELRKLVTRGNDEQHLRHDMTGWTSPTGGALDVGRKLIFALDSSAAQRDELDPVWSRIAVFDFDGKFVRDIHRYDGKAEKPLEPRRTWFDDIEVDAVRQRVYATARRTKELLVFGYDGKPVLFTAGRGGIAVFTDGRVAVGARDGRGIQIYDAELNEAQAIPFSGLVDLETDAAGRLYASSQDPSITFVRWDEALESSESFGPRYHRIRVHFPDTAAVAGEPLRLKVAVEGRPTPTGQDDWQALTRPTDGSDLRWRRLPTTLDKGILTATPPATLRGFHEVAVRFGRGPIPLADRQNALTLQKTFAFRRRGAERSVAVITATGRRTLAPSRWDWFHIIRRDKTRGEAPVTLELVREGKVLAAQTVRVDASRTVIVSYTLARTLLPGRYLLRPRAEGHESYPLAIDLARPLPWQRRPQMQRILYHEFDNEPVTMRQNHLADLPERLAYIHDYVDAVGRLGFTRETDRLVGKLNTKTDPRAWLRDYTPVRLDHPAYAPPEYYAIPSPHSQWEAEYYLDQALRHGIRYDTQLLGHCSGVRFRDEWIAELVPILQRTAQWLGKYPSFYGFNYNDEMFFGQWVTDWKQADKDWLKTMQETKFKGRPKADAYMHALRKMYGAFNAGVKLALPRARTTAAPMWQFPAVEGSYPPAIYEGMSESYSHYLSEGYHYPWYPAHSVDAVRRPGKPLMGVFDNSYDGRGGENYLQDLMQVAARGVQGVGVQHTRPWKDARGASAYRTGNRLMEMYGSIFAECRPANEGAILYSYTQDVTEKRNMMGTPHWERVFTLHSAGLMACIPLEIIFEEDVRRDWLLNQGKPRVPMLFLVGQTASLPRAAVFHIVQFAAAGGIVFTDAASAKALYAHNLGIETHCLKSAFHEGYAADTAYPLFQSALWKLAMQLKVGVGEHRRFPADTDDPWVAVNRFHGGDARYLALTTDEGAPYPWDAGSVWALGAQYRFSVLPRTATLTFPANNGAAHVYDIFEQNEIHPTFRRGRASVPVDLRTFPGRLYAVTPRRVGRPRLAVREQAGPDDAVTSCHVQITDDAGNPMAARAPVRLRWTAGDKVVRERYVLTDAKGSTYAQATWPHGVTQMTLEATEMLNGQSTTVSGSREPSTVKFLFEPPRATTHVRGASVRALLARAKRAGSIGLVLARPDLLDEQDVDSLRTELAKEGIELLGPKPLPATPEPGVTIAVGQMPTRDALGELLWLARQRGLLTRSPLSASIRGAGAGSIAALIAPRAHEEHFIAFLGGDRPALKAVVSDFTKSLGIKRGIYSGRAGKSLKDVEVGKESQAVVPRLADLVGVRLDGIRATPDGKHLLVTAKGYHRNLALLRDDGKNATILRTARIGQAPTVNSAFVSADGARFGASARMTARFGQAMHVIDGDSTRVFPAFGDIGGARNRFAVSDDGNTVIAPGTYGAVCWRRDGKAWREAWAIDYWKTFQTLDWPVADKQERIPQFHAVIPRGADHALILFGEFTDQGWVTPDNPCSAWLAAVNLADGKERWRFDVPILKTLLLPTLHTSANGSKTLLQVQMGSWKKESFRLFTVANGKALGSWDAKVAPLGAAVADATGNCALAFERRLLELRRPNGSLVHNMYWKSQPVSVAFAADGESIFVADDAERLSRVDGSGAIVWQKPLGSVAALAVAGDRVYAARWDGRLQAWSADGKLIWTLDCTPAMVDADPMATVVASTKLDPATLVQATRPSTTTTTVPKGENMLRAGKAALTLGGTKSWMSDGKVQVKPEALTNGETDDVATPWLHLDEVFWDATAGRQVYAEIAFKAPTDVRTLTVHESKAFPNSWPTEALVQVWDPAAERWNTAAFGIHLRGPVQTYRLDLKAIARLRYVPWNSYFRNFYTSEVEVR